MKIFAHRGMASEFPENSHSAIKAAFDQGFEVEVDVRFTKDGEIALVHDRDLLRLCGNAVAVSDLDIDEIRSNEFLTLPAEAMAGFKDMVELHKRYGNQRSIAIHFKQEDQTPENCRKLAESVCEHGLRNRSFIFNLGMEACMTIRELDKDIKLGVIVSDREFEEFVYLPDIIKKAPDIFDIVWAAEFENIYSSGFFNNVKAAGKQVYAVSPELHRNLGHPKAFTGYQEIWPMLYDWGLDGICTDFPIELSESIRSASHEHSI